GVGIAEEWEGDARNPNEWRETHFQVEGPAVFGLHAAFLENWIETDGHMNMATDRLDSIPAKGNTSLQMLHTDASVRWSDSFILFSALLLMAKRTIRITTAYFDPDAPMIDLFRRVRARGVDVQVLVPGPYMDIWVAKIAAETNYEVLLNMGVDIWHYQQAMLHAKVMLIDDGVACVGSANFNQRSLKKDDEIIQVILDPPTVQILQAHFQEDLRFAKQLSTENWNKRSALQRMKEILVRPFRENL
ncbi:MAG: phospholipase D-like domain-containing protein, partial [Thermodesulfobacteriota bacterium]